MVFRSGTLLARKRLSDPPRTAEVKLPRGTTCRRDRKRQTARAALRPFLWFGGNAGDKIPDLGDKVASHTKPNATLKKADRPGHRVIAKNQFTPLETMDCVIARLIGSSAGEEFFERSSLRWVGPGASSQVILVEIRDGDLNRQRRPYA
jgi:hypothetical protein